MSMHNVRRLPVSSPPSSFKQMYVRFVCCLDAITEGTYHTSYAVVYVANSAVCEIPGSTVTGSSCCE
jgi:hypothetical protein